MFTQYLVVKNVLPRHVAAQLAQGRPGRKVPASPDRWRHPRRRDVCIVHSDDWLVQRGQRRARVQEEAFKAWEEGDEEAREAQQGRQGEGRITGQGWRVERGGKALYRLGLTFFGSVSQLLQNIVIYLSAPQLNFNFFPVNYSSVKMKFNPNTFWWLRLFFFSLLLWPSLHLKEAFIAWGLTKTSFTYSLGHHFYTSVRS